MRAIKSLFMPALVLLITCTGCSDKRQEGPDERSKVAQLPIEGTVKLEGNTVIEAAERLRRLVAVPINLEEREYTPDHAQSLTEAISTLQDRQAKGTLSDDDRLRLDYYRELLQSGTSGETIVMIEKTRLGEPTAPVDISGMPLAKALERITQEDSDYTFEFNPPGCATLFPAAGLGSILNGTAPGIHVESASLSELMSPDGPVGRLLAERDITVLWTDPLFLDSDPTITLTTEPMPLRNLLCAVSRKMSPQLAWTLAGLRGLRVLTFQPLLPEPSVDDGDQGPEDLTVPAAPYTGPSISVKAECVYEAPPPPSGDFQATPSADCDGTLRVPINKLIAYQAVNAMDVDRGNEACVPREQADTIVSFTWRYRAPGASNDLRGQTVSRTSPREHDATIQMTLTLDDQGNPADDPPTQVAQKQLLSTLPDRDPSRDIGDIACPGRRFGRGDSYGGTVTFSGCPQVPYDGCTVSERQGAIGLMDSCNLGLRFRTGGPSIPVVANNQYGTPDLADRLFLCANRDRNIGPNGCQVAFSTQWRIQQVDYIRHRNAFSIPPGTASTGGGFNALTTSRTP